MYDANRLDFRTEDTSEKPRVVVYNAFSAGEPVIAVIPIRDGDVARAEYLAHLLIDAIGFDEQRRLHMRG